MALSLEEAAAHGYHLVVDAEEKVFERVHAAGTQVIRTASLEDGLAEIEKFLNRFRGATGTDISRSDGTPELRDDLVAKAAETATSGPTPAADAAAGEAAAPSEPEVDTTGVTTDTPGETTTGLVDVPAAPAEPEAPEGTVAS